MSILIFFSFSKNNFSFFFYFVASSCHNAWQTSGERNVCFDWLTAGQKKKGFRFYFLDFCFIIFVFFLAKSCHVGYIYNIIKYCAWNICQKNTTNQKQQQQKQKQITLILITFFYQIFEIWKQCQNKKIFCVIWMYLFVHIFFKSFLSSSFLHKKTFN